MDDDASISRLEDDFPTWVDDDLVDEENEVEFEHDLYNAVKDDEEAADIFVEFDQDYEEDIISNLDEAVVLKELGAMFPFRDQGRIKELNMMRLIWGMLLLEIQGKGDGTKMRGMRSTLLMM
nr:hypothetical protein [Tanacetum cinerariifolium]